MEGPGQGAQPGERGKYKADPRSYTVFFDFGKADIHPSQHKELDGVVKFLKSYPRSEVIVEGHAGADAYIADIAKSRAEEVAKYINDKAGVKPTIRFHQRKTKTPGDPKKEDPGQFKAVVIVRPSKDEAEKEAAIRVVNAYLTCPA